MLLAQADERRFVFRKARLLGRQLYAEGLYFFEGGFEALRKRGMAEDFSWARSAKKYREIYDSICK